MILNAVRYIVRGIERLAHEPSNTAGLARCRIAHHHQLALPAPHFAEAHGLLEYSLTRDQILIQWVQQTIKSVRKPKKKNNETK